jgi:predicted nucleic acid-binding protein
MNVVDSSGWLEYFGRGSNREAYRSVIQDAEQLIVPTISIFEVFKRILVQRDEEEALKAIGWMSRGIVVELSQEIAVQATILSVEYKLPMADSMILATAHAYEAELWTQDEHFAGLLGVHYINR